jgi:tungstate transport system substrate-binding protein
MPMIRPKLISAFLLCLTFSLFTGCEKQPTEPVKDKSILRLATTTSTADSGLLGVLIPVFESKYNVKVHLLAKGTGAALDAARQGQADVVLAHARKAENDFITEGYGINRKDVMYNDFVIVGPPDDPAEVKKAEGVLSALTQIYQTKEKFISRGDNSGTHTRETELWKLTKNNPTGKWYLMSKSGMLKTLKMASKQDAYTLSDRSTYLFNREELDLVIVSEGDELLYNDYGVIAVNPAKVDGVNFEAAMQFIDFITSLEGQEIIAGYGRLRFGKPLYIPLGVEK